MNIPRNLSVEELNELIQALVQSEQPIVITTYTFPHEMEQYMEQVMEVFFQIIEQEAITDYVIYFVKELIGNAKKANSKRVYFTDKGLDIHCMEDYLKGMKTFKSELLDNKDYYLALQEREGLYIQLRLWKEGESVKIEVSNNVRIAVIEEKRMMNKIEMGMQYKALEKAVSEAIDDMEGSGLGLIILVLMMKKMGTSADQIRIEKSENETKIGVEIPAKEMIETAELVELAEPID